MFKHNKWVKIEIRKVSNLPHTHHLPHLHRASADEDWATGAPPPLQIPRPSRQQDWWASTSPSWRSFCIKCSICWKEKCITYHIGYHTEKTFNFHCIPFNTIKIKFSQASQTQKRCQGTIYSSKIPGVSRKFQQASLICRFFVNKCFKWYSLLVPIYSLLLVVQGWVVCCRKYVGADIGIVSTKNFPGSTCLLPPPPPPPNLLNPNLTPLNPCKFIHVYDFLIPTEHWFFLSLNEWGLLFNLNMRNYFSK